MAGGLIARHQPLVGVHQGVRHGAEAPGVVQQPRQELPGLAGQALRGGGVGEDILPVPGEGHVEVHPAARDAGKGLGHEGGVEAAPLGQGLHRQLAGHDVVRGGQGIRVFQVDLVLSGGGLVVAGLHLDAHLLQGQGHLPPDALPVVQGAQVKVARLVGGPGGGPSVLLRLEEEKLQLRPHLKDLVSRPA